MSGEEVNEERVCFCLCVCRGKTLIFCLGCSIYYELMKDWASIITDVSVRWLDVYFYEILVMRLMRTRASLI